MTIKRLTAVAGTILAAGVLPASAPAATTPVPGRWQQLVNCAFTSYDPLTGRATCVGSSLWTGSWTGITRYTFAGRYDLFSGDADGTLRETFLGSAADGSHGTLTFDEHLALDGATSRIHIDARIVGSTGGFAGSQGDVAFDGIDNVATGFGTYAGRWVRP